MLTANGWTFVLEWDVTPLSGVGSTTEVQILEFADLAVAVGAHETACRGGWVRDGMDRPRVGELNEWAGIVHVRVVLPEKLLYEPGVDVRGAVARAADLAGRGGG